MSKATAIFTVILAVTTSSIAFAQTSEEMEEAKEHFTTGAEFYTAGDYSKAIVEFINGHNIAPNAMFLYNISLSYQRLDNFEDARDAARKARGFEGMNGELSTRNEARIESLSTVINARDVAATLGKTTNVEKPVEVDRNDGFGAVGWSGIALAAIGAGGVGYALYLNQQVEEGKDELAVTTDFGARQAIADEMNSNRSRGRIALFSGIGIGTVGLAMIAWDLLDDPDETRVSLAPLVTSSESGLVVHGRF